MTKIVVINQSHVTAKLKKALDMADNESFLTREDKITFNAAAESQYNIAKYLEQNKEAVVIQENSAAFRHGVEKQWDEFISNIIFPDELSDLSFDQLTFNQKKYLVHFGACFYAVHKGIIKQTYNDHPKLIDKDLLPSRDKALTKFKGTEQKVKWAEHSQSREYLALSNAEEIARQTGLGKVLLVYGSTHLFEDVHAKCFSNLDLKKIDMSFNERHSQAAQQACSDLISNRPLTINCSNLALGPNQVLQLPVSNNSVVDQSRESPLYGTTALVGLLAFGMFYCCSRYKNSKAKEAEINNSQIDHNKKNEKRNFNKKYKPKMS